MTNAAENDAPCGYCGEPASNCPNSGGECCCLPCYDHPAHAPLPISPDEVTP